MHAWVFASTLSLSIAAGTLVAPRPFLQTQPKYDSGTVVCHVVNGSGAKSVPGIPVHLVNRGNRTDKMQTTDKSGTVEFNHVPFGQRYALQVFSSDGKLLGVDASFSLSSSSPLHTCVPDIDISRSTH